MGEQEELEVGDERLLFRSFFPFFRLVNHDFNFQDLFLCLPSLQLNLFLSFTVVLTFIWRIKWNHLYVLSTAFRSVTYIWQSMKILHGIVVLHAIKKKLRMWAKEAQSKKTTCNRSFSVSINISRQNECKEAVRHYQMKVVEFWRWQGYSETKFSQRTLTSLGQSMASIEKMKNKLIKKAVLSRNFVLGNLNRLLEEPFSLCIDYTRV